MEHQSGNTILDRESTNTSLIWVAAFWHFGYSFSPSRRAGGCKQFFSSVNQQG
jgi:hypothetical protein